MICLGIFIDSSTSSYNVLSVYSDKDQGKVCFERLDLGGQSNDPCPSQDLSWRNFNIPEFDKLNGQKIYEKFLYYLSKEGILYIVTLLKVGPRKPKIICFDIVKQASTILDVPQISLGFDWPNLRIQLWRGKPALIFVLEEQLNIWVLDDYKRQKWADTIKIPLPFLKQFPGIKETVPYALVFCEDEDAMLVYDEDDIKGCIVYKLKSKELDVIPYVPCMIPATLVSVKGMQPVNSN
ncbi:hypothetical protein DCAR_0831075 [Daucus carota subsp. sativus]|uniref:F-box associated beta-propeller type 3 domain-containing protein n=1 Tax=Daucus carota subsp. sativus TaxID=79200 RepID=A0AAF1B9V0_DAUCS|nr:hypothetical protein DCAR_0831075 [Daucus carota subsp. sativus]